MGLSVFIILGTHEEKIPGVYPTLNSPNYFYTGDKTPNFSGPKSRVARNVGIVEACECVVIRVTLCNTLQHPTTRVLQ